MRTRKLRDWTGSPNTCRRARRRDVIHDNEGAAEVALALTGSFNPRY
ncbi:MAG: hypothetical protein JO168_06995 [Solirubrobacterales bacterium]|nr:hypothetical protein [Solirubrobacterales bacterium]